MRWPEISRLLLRALGILMVAWASFHLAMLFVSISRYNFLGDQVGVSDRAYGSLLALYILPHSAFLMLGLALIFLAPKIVRRFSRATATEQVEINLEAIENILIAVLGIYFIVDSLADLSRVMLTVALHFINPAYGTQEIYGNLLEVSVKFAIGIVLIVRNHGVSAFVQHLRNRVRKLRDWPT